MIGDGKHHSTRIVLFLELLVQIKIGRSALPTAVTPVRKVEQVGGPVVQSVENMRSVNDGGTPLFRLFDEPLKKVLADAYVKAGCDLIQQQDLERPNETDKDLNTTALAVRELVHSPVKVDIQHLNQLVPSLWVRLLEFLHEAVDGDVGAQGDSRTRERNAAHAPIAIEISTVEVELGVAEGVEPEDTDASIGLAEVPSGQDAQQRTLAGAISTFFTKRREKIFAGQEYNTTDENSKISKEFNSLLDRPSDHSPRSKHLEPVGSFRSRLLRMGAAAASLLGL